MKYFHGYGFFCFIYVLFLMKDALVQKQNCVETVTKLQILKLCDDASDLCDTRILL